MTIASTRKGGHRLPAKEGTERAPRWQMKAGPSSSPAKRANAPRQEGSSSKLGSKLECALSGASRMRALMGDVDCLWAQSIRECPPETGGVVSGVKCRVYCIHA